ncbi:hypothetical protein D9613_003680 [Agrocybe pediades]|uniref:Uncharacterized protein n=1 Tax=Agrocybe pediades TaxID=84607 RepID=A0A8H4QIE2_9AGAR|nr:hypothetical protein D9613_003680 [Agrocybe pediades]
MLQHPRFLETRPWTLKTLNPFDRKAYIDALLSQYPAVPEEFRLWIMEWPARMVPFGMWPGSPFTYHHAVTLEEANGTNWLAYLPEGSPSLLTLLHSHPSHDDHCIPALLFWKDDLRTYWLIFEHSEPELMGRVIINDLDVGDLPMVCYLPHPVDMVDGLVITHNDWLQFLEHRWDEQVDLVLALERPPPTYTYPQTRISFRKDEPIAYPVTCNLGDSSAVALPTYPWRSSSTPQVLEELHRYVYLE